MNNEIWQEQLTDNLGEYLMEIQKELEHQIEEGQGELLEDYKEWLSNKF